MLEILLLTFKLKFYMISGVPCFSGTEIICHGDIISALFSLENVAFICNNGKKQVMTLPKEFSSPRESSPRCKYQVKFNLVFPLIIPYYPILINLNKSFSIIKRLFFLASKSVPSKLYNETRNLLM